MFTCVAVVASAAASADTQHSVAKSNSHNSHNSHVSKADTQQSAGTHQSAHTHQSASARLQSMQDDVKTGRQNVEKALGNMASRQTELIAMSKDDSELQSMAGSIQSHVTPTLSGQQRKALEDDYQTKLTQIRNFDSSSADAQKNYNELQAAAEKDADELREADRKDARNSRVEVSKSHRTAKDDVKSLTHSSRTALSEMPSPTHLEFAEKRASKTEHQYDHDEDALQHEKDRYMDRIMSLQDRMYDVLEDIYSKVEHHVEANTRRHEQEDNARRSDLQQAVRAMQAKMASEKLFESPPWFGSIQCAAFIVGGLSASLVFHVMQRLGESRTRINQPELLA